MLALPNFLENAAAGALPLEPFERTFQGLIFTNTNLRHCYPSPRSKKRLIGATEKPARTSREVIIPEIRETVNAFFES